MNEEAEVGVTLKPFALKDNPALIEIVFPAQKISFEAQKERKANLGQTLTGLGSYWKGRKPLILVRAIVLGSLLPQSGDVEADLAIFEKLMALDVEGLTRRALANSAFNPKEIARRIYLDQPFQYFNARINGRMLSAEEHSEWNFPLNCDENGIQLRWKKGVSEKDKLDIYRKTLATFDTYEEKAALCKRPEEVDQNWLYEPVWKKVNQHYESLGVVAHSVQDLIEQLGILRYGHRPKVGDSFCGGGSIPFEAARLGCDVYASDLNPIACMLTWGAFNIVGASSARRSTIELEQRDIADMVNQEISNLGIEHDEEGNRAKAYLYCLETRCPQTGWSVPMSPTWVISRSRNVIARLIPDSTKKTFSIEVCSGVTSQEMKEAEIGTVRNATLVYELDNKTYRTPIKTLRGDYRLQDGTTGNRLRRWDRHDFKPRTDDIFQERLYAVQWITKDALNSPRQETYFASVTVDDLAREEKVERLVAESLSNWQAGGIVPDMEIEPGDETTRLLRERGWTHWHHLFNPRQLLLISRYFKHRTPEADLFNAKSLDWNSRLSLWMNHWDKTNHVFYNQALNTFYNFGIRCFTSHEAGRIFRFVNCPLPPVAKTIECIDATSITHNSDLWVTDPPYADAIHYHEITEYFIAWLRNNTPTPFDRWIWDSRRALAIKGSGEDFRRGMVAAYAAMAAHMPDHGAQCVMFTHQDTGVWSDMAGIFWAAGLQVVAAWYIATETTSELKKGGYVQGTVILMLKKRSNRERVGFKQNLLPAVRREVQYQIEAMMHLNGEIKANHGQPVFNDSDLQMAGYAAALKVLTSYTRIGDDDVTSFALRPRKRGETTVIEEIVQQASEAANSLLIPEGLGRNTWTKLSGIQRFYLRMMDIETSGVSKLDNYQNFAKAFRIDNFGQVMGNIEANNARLKRITEFTSHDLRESAEIGKTWLWFIIVGLQQLLNDIEPQAIVSEMQSEMPDFIEIRPYLLEILSYIGIKSPEQTVRESAEVLEARIRNLRVLEH